MPRHSIASICSVTRIVPSSAAVKAPILPASRKEMISGPTSRTTAEVLRPPRNDCASYCDEDQVELEHEDRADENPGECDRRQRSQRDVGDLAQDRA